MGYQDDQTRKILNLIREGNVESKKQIIKEQNDPTLNPMDQMLPSGEYETADMPVLHVVPHMYGTERDLNLI